MSSKSRLFLLVSGLVLVLALSACTSNAPPPAPTAAPTVTALVATATAVSTATPSPTPTSPPPTITPTPTRTATPEPTATATPDPVAGLTIEDLRTRSYGGGTIETVRTMDSNAAYTRYLIAYPSDGLRITGVMAVPKGSAPEGGFPVIVLNHGYINPAVYKTGTRYVAYVDYYAQHGYLVLNPDYRNHDGSDQGPNPFRIGYAIDVLNLLAEIKTLPQANPERVGMIGHSMGGNVTQRVLVVTDTVKAAVLYASTSGREGERWRSFTAGDGGTPDPTRTPRPGERDFGGLFGGLDIPRASLPQVYARISPASYYQDITTPISIHHGDADQTVPPQLSVRLRDDLLALGKEVEYFTYPGQPHSFVGNGFNLLMQRTTAFFDRYLKGE
jgi:dipeptidyl aminopeptidase/acylaminoacyl peptidase